MATIMILTNKTASDLVLADLGNATVPASTSKDLITDLNLKLEDIAHSDDLVTALSTGTDNYQMNNGNQDLSVSEGLRFVGGLLQVFPEVENIPKVRADSRPKGMTNYFTNAGDDSTAVPKIGNGKVLSWDWSDSSTDVITNAQLDALAGEYGDTWPFQIPSGYKAKRIVFKFSEDIYLKEGTLYFFDAAFGGFSDMFIVCPQGQYYYNREGVPTQAVDGPVVLSHYCNHLMMHGDCPMGDEFNSEGCTERAIPPSYEWWLMITVPTADNTCKGYVELELYRPRTCLLPGESLS